MLVKFIIDDWYPCYMESDDKEHFEVEFSEAEYKEFKKAMKLFLKAQQMVKLKLKEKDTLNDD